ncbi:hypothetical protein IMSHALPRED_002673 [Imshaugia aleurites]|uniref:Uncharacterized protein n=1 Tax=Imshaugia aleurites TaxID=172621 RepID=A0A8H3IEL5_9LECA|nr:hypothetical protein IMSHALPRED_002673 [Imshaugia aleurites]
MGRQAYLTRVCLGRSAFEPLTETVAEENQTQALQSTTDNPEETTEPAIDTVRQVQSRSYQQQYDRKGYPENPASRALSRQSRRAINDILATVGVCVGVDADGQIRPVHDGSTAALDQSKISGVIRENEIGMLVGFTEEALDELAGMCTTGLRNRIQTFRFYSGVPLTAIIKSEWIHLGFLRGLFAGGPADTAYIVLNAGRFLGMNMLMERLASGLGISFDSGFTRDINWFVLKNSGRLLNMTILGLLTPFRIFSTLQHQGLLPAWPLFPHPKAFIPFSPWSPLRLPDLPARSDGASCLRFLASLAVSPVVLLCVRSWIRPLVEYKVQKYTRAALPAPDYPDIYSIQAAIEDEIDRDQIPGLGNAIDTPELWESTSVTQELAKDLQYIGRNFQILHDTFWGLFSRPSKKPSTSPVLEPLTIPTPTPALMDPPEDDASPTSPSYDPSSSSASRPSTPRPQIEISGSTASNGVVHMSVAIPVPASSIPRRRRYSAHPRDPHAPSTPRLNNLYCSYHRITTLTAQAADSMAQHLSGYITDILLLPLEALYVRSVALSFLSSPAATGGGKMVAERWKGEVYPLGCWFGMGPRGDWRGVGDYVGKMVLVQGLEMGFGFAVWQASVGLSWWVGRKWFEWGRL